MQEYRTETYKQLQKHNLLDFIDVSFLNKTLERDKKNNNYQEK